MTDLGPAIGWLLILTFILACAIGSRLGWWENATSAGRNLVSHVQDAMTGRVHDTREDEPA